MQRARVVELRRACCGVPVWMLDTTCSSNSRLSGTEKLRSASMLLASDPARGGNFTRASTEALQAHGDVVMGRRTVRNGAETASAQRALDSLGHGGAIFLEP